MEEMVGMVVREVLVEVVVVVIVSVLPEAAERSLRLVIHSQWGLQVMVAKALVLTDRPGFYWEFYNRDIL